MYKKVNLLITWLLAISISLVACSKESDNIFSDNNLVIDEDEAEDLLTELEKEINIDISEDEEEYLLLTAIMSNDDLSEEDKNIFYNLIYVILDNPYLNKEDAYDRWANLKIYYPDEKQENIGGEYYSLGNYINFYDNKRIVKTHEGIHSLIHDIKNTKKFSRSICEGVTELLNLEYYSEEPFIDSNGYGYEIAYVKMLCDIIGSDKVLEAFTTGDYTIITKSLTDISGTEEEVEWFISVLEGSLDEVSKMENGGQCTLSYTSEEIYKAFDSLDRYFVARNKDLDAMTSYLYNKQLFFNMYEGNGQIGYYDFFVKNGVLEKAYFSEELKEKYPTAVIKEYDSRSLVKVKMLSE